nr:uncharacterized protein LOC105334517 [Crassostrea gigas]
MPDILSVLNDLPFIQFYMSHDVSVKMFECIGSVCAFLAIFSTFSFAHLDNFVIRVISDIGPCACKLECYSSTKCASVNYDLNNFECELSSYNGSLFNESNATEFYQSFSMDNIKQEFSDPCNGILCGPNMKCITSTNGILCIITECGEPLAVTNTIPSSLSSLRAVGTVLMYQCDSVGTPVGNLTSVCQSNGVWSHITGYCKVCGTLPSVPNGAVGPGFDFQNAVRNITCQLGFMLSTPDNTITCQGDGNWSAINTTCIIHECPASFHHDMIKELCIRVFDVPATWDDADTVCQNYSQRLININTPSQITILTQYLRSLTNVDERDDIHVGGRLVDGQYRWMVTNKTIAPAVWDVNNPSESMKVCTHFHDTEHLRDKECTALGKYACGVFY